MTILSQCQSGAWKLITRDLATSWGKMFVVYVTFWAQALCPYIEGKFRYFRGVWHTIGVNLSLDIAC